MLSGNVRLAMSHVVPDLVQKVLKGQDPLRILGDGSQIRHYTYGGDLARGIVTTLTHPDAVNEDFNLSTAESTSVTELAGLIWRKIKGPEVPLRLQSDQPYAHDVQRRVPDVEKAGRYWASRPPPPSMTCSMRSFRGSSRRSARDGCRARHAWIPGSGWARRADGASGQSG